MVIGSRPSVGLTEAVAAAKNWYTKLAGKELPRWNYRIQNYGDFLEAIDDYKGQVEAALRKRKNSRLKLRVKRV